MRQVTITFKREDLLYDIANYSFVEGDLMEVSDEHQRHQAIDVCEDGNIERVNRVLGLAYSEVVESMYPYTKKECEDEEVRDNGMVVPESSVVVMSVPDEFASSTVDLLTNLIHEYLVCRVVGDWMSITNPKSRAAWDEKAEYARMKMRGCVNSRMVRLRRKMSPW